MLVLGLGNDVLSDDAVGLLAARELRSRLADRPGVRVEETTEMGLALLDHAVDFDDLVLVDAIQTGQVPPGAVHEIDEGQLQVLPMISPHFLGVGETLALGRQLGLKVPERVRIFAVEVQDPFTLGAELTLAVREALPSALERIEAAVRVLSGTNPGPPL